MYLFGLMPDKKFLQHELLLKKDLASKSDLESLCTKSDLESLCTKSDLAVLKAEMIGQQDTALAKFRSDLATKGDLKMIGRTVLVAFVVFSTMMQKT